MTPEQFSKNILTTTLGSLVGGRVYPENLAARVYPAVVWSVDNEDVSYGLGKTAGSIRFSLTVDAYANQLTECVSLQSTLRDVLHGYHDSDCIYATFVDGGNQSVAPKDDSQKWVFIKTAEYHVRLNL